MTSKFNIWTILKYFFLTSLVAVTLYPMLYMVSISLSDTYHVLKNDITFYPKGINLGMYKFVLKDPRIFRAYKNTIVYTVTYTLIALTLTSLAAYSLSKRNRLPFCKTINIMVLITMFFRGGMIPTYLTVTGLGLYDTIWAVILPPAISTYNLIIMRTFFLQYPREIEESGRMDGLSDIGVFWFLVLPTSTAVMATIGLFYAVGMWGSFFGPFIYLKSNSKYPLQIILRQIVLLGLSEENDFLLGSGKKMIPEDSIKYTAIVVTVIPIIMVYPYLQKYFVKGVMIGSLKG